MGKPALVLWQKVTPHGTEWDVTGPMTDAEHLEYALSGGKTIPKRIRDAIKRQTRR